MAKFDFKTKLPFGEMFLVKSSEIEGRIDIDFYRPNLTEIEKKILAKSKKRLKDFALSMGSGATPSTTNPEFYSDKNGIPLLRVQNLTLNSTVKLNNLKYITEDVHENMLKRSQVTDQDLLVKITGVGRMAVAAVPPKEFSGNVNQHIVVVRTGSREKSLYLANYLNLDVIEKLASRRVTGGTRPALDYPALRSIPIIEDIDFSILENAKKQANQLKQQAKTLLNSINSYLLGELGITLPETDNSLNSRMFTVQMSEVGVGRLDSFTYQPRFTKLAETLEQCRYAVASLAKVATDIKNGVEIRNYVEEGFRYLRVTDLSEHGLNHSSPKFVDVHGVPEKIRLNPNCLLIARSGSLGLVNVVTEDIKDAILSSHIFKVELDTTQIYPEYLEAFARCPIGQEQFKQLNNGGVIPEINQSALKTFKVALPDKSTQQKIIAHIRAIKAQAATLQAEAEQLLSQAKAEIEQMILGGAQ
jgi:putative type I restriction modification DNA specificity domain protein